MQFKLVNTWSPIEKKYRWFRLIYNLKDPNDNQTLSFSLSFYKCFYWQLENGGTMDKPWYYEWRLNILGLSVHWKRGFGGHC
jgi:hypothetical protein